ncbi:MAG: 23S rRNA (pseudouridine(1915)-N(3))-methyltransferase RlmH, partial [Deltaproteobacteria bacterium]|nr:23S rRNA (pseudouridine(1915)-N(3))-methyltransferase RlmH [Deltaproteobacteria bacterium]
MKQKIIWIGKGGERFVQDGVAHYLKRLKPFAQVELVELKAAGHSGRDPAQAVLAEEEDVLRRLTPRDTLILLDERGETLSSRELAALLDGVRQSAAPDAAWVIGGAYGVTDNLRRRAIRVVSLSKMTFPHQLVRV